LVFEIELKDAPLIPYCVPLFLQYEAPKGDVAEKYNDETLLIVPSLIETTAGYEVVWKVLAEENNVYSVELYQLVKLVPVIEALSALLVTVDATVGM
jgi:hypothetical protein